jgi:N-acetylglucosamine kinase-like BadF-type ATPase
MTPTDASGAGLPDLPEPPFHLGLGLDAGGTQTRWALVSEDGRLRAQGHAPAFSALQMNDGPGRSHVAAVLREVADAVQVGLRAMSGASGPLALCAGITGFDVAGDAALRAALATAIGLPASCIEIASDIEMACRSTFAPGEGMLLYAGTGSIAGHVDARGVFHRAGGRGVLLDDAGGGHWIAIQALRQVWRAEDERPGAWRESLLARRLFEQIGGSDWADTRRAVYAATRGEVGRLALAVAAAARDGDASAQAVLRRAGLELARLALAMRQRLPVRRVALAGRVFELGPAVEAGLREGLHEALRRADLDLVRTADPSEVAAARRAVTAVLRTGGDRLGRP